MKDKIKLNALVESWCSGFGRITSICSSNTDYFTVTFPNLLREDKTRYYSLKDLELEVIKIIEE